MKVALITTTINVPKVLARYVNIFPDHEHELLVIIAGDMKSPHEDIEKMGSDLSNGRPWLDWRYLRPEIQAEFGYSTSELVGWRSIQRRNVAVLEAIRSGAEITITVDDDNDPVTGDYFERMITYLTGHADTVEIVSSTGWYNAARELMPVVCHRGFPYSHRHEAMTVTSTLKPASIAVAAGLWLGDPDIDAMERLVRAPICRGITDQANEGFVLALGTWCPFNSQNTGWRTELAPLMMCWPGVGRMDDIWASYLARSVLDHLGWSVHYGHPIVYQDRNEHDLLVDLEKEMLGYRYTDALCDALRVVHYGPERDLLQCMEIAYQGVCDSDVPISTQTKESFNGWLNDVSKILKNKE